MDPATTVWQVRTDADLLQVRRIVRECSVRAGMSLIEQTKFMTAATELARNALVHGGGGRVECTELERAVRLVVTDQGPGIADPELALTDGYSTVGGLGLGLGGTRRLVDEFDLHSSLGSGTTAVITSWARPAGGVHPTSVHGSAAGPRWPPC